VAWTDGNTGEINSSAQQNTMYQQSEVDTGVQQNVTHWQFELGIVLESTQTGRIARPQRVRRPPARYRQLYHDQFVGIQSVSCDIDESIVLSNT
jgi:hypothetical protein